MSQSRTPADNQTPPRTSSYLNAYVVGWTTSNFALLVGHPAERIKVALQNRLGVPGHRVIFPILTQPKNLYTGFPACVYRLNVKLTYRALLMTEMPQKVDTLGLNPLLANTLKAVVASSIDTALTIPFENITTWQMTAGIKTKLRDTASAIYHIRGYQGFLFGLQPGLSKSFVTWLYLFMGHQAIKDKREQQQFLSTLLWATATSVPITMLTNPLDVIKTTMQATSSSQPKSFTTVGKNIVSQHGMFALSRGFTFRLIHKSLVTASAYLMLDTNSKLRP